MHAMDGGLVIDAYTELITLNQFDRAGVAMIRKLVASEAKRFPALRPASGWTGEAFDEATQAFLAAKLKGVTEGALATATDETSLSRYLRKAIRNHLVDQARRTPRGRVYRKLGELLSQEARFAESGDFWHPADRFSDPYGGPTENLVRAAYSVPGIQRKKWSGDREAPLASDADLLRLLDAIFTEAAGSLDIATLTEVLVQRFPAAVALADSSLDEAAFRLATSVPRDRPDLAVEFRSQAEELVAGLSPAERVLVPLLDERVDTQMAALGLGRTQTYRLVAQVKEKLRVRLPNDDAAQVLVEVMDLCSGMGG